MTIKISFPHDQDPPSPRENDNLGTLSCRQHRRHAFGDEQFPGSLDGFVAKLPKGSLVVPVYIYEHGDISISTAPFSCQFDSAQLGVIWASPEKIRSEYGRVTTSAIEKARSVLEAEVLCYGQYVSGEAFGISIKRPGEAADECWGFLGSNVFENGMSEHVSDEELPVFFEAAQKAGMEGTKEQMAEESASRIARKTRQAKASVRSKRL